MLMLEQYDFIRTACRVYGKSIWEIHRETGHDRKTIRKALSQEPFVYGPRSVQYFPVLRPYLAFIDQWLEEDKLRQKKQRHTARRIYTRLQQEHGFTGSESTVRHYVREAKLRLGVKTAAAFIPLDPEVGQEAEVDWGTAQAIIDGHLETIKFFCLRSKYAGKHFVCSYPCERQQAFFDGHIQAFRFFDGVFPTIIYDNLTTAVHKVLRGKDRQEQEAFARFHAYYNFQPRFCNPAQAHEKGGVEGLIGFVRRNYLVPLPEATSLEELNQQLLRQCLAYGQHRIQGREGTVQELFEAETAHLLPLPEVPFSNLQITTGKVDAYATVRIENNRYSVPPLSVGRKVTVQLQVDRVEIFHSGKRLATHARLFGKNKWQLEPDHYLELLQQRPEAFRNARPIRQWRPSWPPVLEKLLATFQASQGQTAGIKDFISVLMLYRDYSPDEIHQAVAMALERHLKSSAGIRHLLNHSQPAPEFPPLANWPATEVADISRYGLLGGVS
jgi:transposase